MARRRRGQPLHGWLVLDKAYDYGSTEAVSKLRWLFDAQKAGHAGTLDPLATGVLPVAFGEATKTVPYIQDGKKTYRFTAKWGEARSTDDREGEVIATSAHRPERSEIEARLCDFEGNIEQIPPAFSAVKIDGERAYDLAREGVAVTPPSRMVCIDRLSLLDCPSEDEAVFEAVTGKGTYIRALVRDLAKALGTVGHVAALRRTAVGPFSEEMAVTMEELTGRPSTDRLTVDDRPAEPAQFLLPVEAALAEHLSATVDRAQAARLLNGGDAILAAPSMTGLRAGRAGDIEPVMAMEGDKPVAICRLEGMKLRPVKVFAFRE